MAPGTDGSDHASRDRPVRRYVSCLFAAAAGLVALDVAIFGWRWPSDAAVALAFVPVLAGAEYLILRFRYRGQIDGLNLFEAVLTPLLFAFPAVVVVPAVGLAQLIAAIARRNRPLKGAFNIAQWMVAAGAGALVMSALRSGSDLTATNVAATVAAITVVAIVNQVEFSVVIALAEHRPIQDVIGALRQVLVLGWVMGGAVNIAFGILFLAAYQWSPASIGLFIVPLVVLHWANGAYAAARADQRRLEALHRASSRLGAAVDPLDALDGFLEEVRACFEAEAAELVLVEGPGFATRRVPESQRPLSPAMTKSLLALSEPARITAQAGSPDGWRDCLAAPLIDDAATVGVLCTYNRMGLEGFEDGELSVLAALAADIVAALQRGALVQRVIDERRKLRDILGRASDGIFTMSIEGTVTSWNPAMEESTGHRAYDMVGRAGFGVLRPRDVDGCDVMLERWATTDEALAGDLQILTRSGERRWLSCSYSRAVEPEGAGESLVVIARDVTKVREVERLREDFVATVSHELRTPLAPIKGWASTLLQVGDTLQPEDRQAAYQSILRQSQRLERLIVNLLEVSKIEHGMLEAADADIDIAAVVHRVVCDFEKTSPDRAFTVLGAGSFCARAKELWVEQIVTNLVSNAVKYSPDTEPVEVALSQRNGCVRIAVRDHGCGIPAHELQRVFERFHRVRETRTQTGTGLGLYIARQLAEEMDGTISVESITGQGSTFVLDLPAVPRVVDVRSHAEIIGLEAS